MQKSKIKVVDNFLPDDQFKDISEGMLGNFFPWFWQKHSHGYKLEDGTFIEDNIPQLTHCFSDDGNIFSEYFKYFENSSLFSEAEKVALRFTIAASSVPVSTSQELEELLQHHWDETDILEIMSVIALFGYLNRWNDVMGTSLEKDAKDSAESLLQNHWDIGKHAT